MIKYIRTNFDNIENRVFIVIFNIIDFIEFNKKLFNILFKLLIKIYALIVLLITIIFEIIKVFYIRIMFINANENFYNIYFYNKYIMSIVFL